MRQAHALLAGLLVCAAGAVPGSVGAEEQPAQPPASPSSPTEEGGSDFGDFSELDLESLLSTPLVESASRRAQSWLDAPSSVTVLDRDTLQGTVGMSVAELMRRVPGLFLLQDGRSDYNVGIRGINSLFNNRVLLLVDGVLITDRITGRQLWPTLAIHPEDIAHIEVIRGPGSTTYGTNAMNGVVSISTLRPLDRQGWSATLFTGMDFMEHRPLAPDERWVAGLGGGQLAFAWANEGRTLGLRLSTNLQHVPDTWDLAHRYPHTAFQYGLNALLQYRPDPELELRVTFSHSQAEFYFMASKAFSTGSSHNQSLGLHLEKKNLLWDWLDLKLDLDARRMQRTFDSFDTIERDASSSMAAFFVGGSDCAYDAHALLLLDVSLWEGRNITTLGGELTYVALEDFPTGKPWLLFTGLVLQNDTAFLADRSLLLSVGARFELIQAHEDSFGDLTYRHISPRVALVWRFLEEHSLRLSGSSAHRTPVPHESLVDIRLPAAVPGDPPIRVLRGNPRLQPEQLYALEAGYRGLLFDMLRADAVFFVQRVDGLIGDERVNALPVVKANLLDIEQLGLELGLKLNPATWASAYLNYTYTYSRDRHTHAGLKEWPSHLWALGTELRLPGRLRLNLDAQLLFDYRPTIELGGVSTGYPLQTWQPIQSADQAWVDLRLGKSLLDDRIEVFVAVKNLLGFWRDEDGVRSYPSPNAEPIGGTLLLGLRLETF